MQSCQLGARPALCTQHICHATPAALLCAARHKTEGRKRGGGGGARSSDSEGEQPQAGVQYGRDAGTLLLGPALHCADETAIFQELGLAFVPVHMRMF